MEEAVDLSYDRLLMMMKFCVLFSQISKCIDGVEVCLSARVFIYVNSGNISLKYNT